MSHTQRILASSEDPNWRTPKALFEALDAEFAFDLDAAADAQNHLCDIWFGPGSPWAEDALSVAWAAEGGMPLTVFVNPPYSVKAYRESLKAGAPNKAMLIESWVQKAADEAVLGSTVVGVIPYSPQTEWWRNSIEGHGDYAPLAATVRATEVRRLPYRVKFDPSPEYKGAASGANINTAIVVWKPAARFVEPWQPHCRYWSYR